MSISPQTRANSRRSVGENELTFPILPDPRNDVAATFGLRFKLPDYLIDLYRNVFKNNLGVVNGDPSWTLPMSARFAIGQDGIILYAEVNPDYTRGADPEELLPASGRRLIAAASHSTDLVTTNKAKSMTRLHDDVVVITGGSSGTQLATSQRFVEMSAFSASYVSRVLRATPTLARVFDAAARRWRWLMTSLFDPYRPELHYMRGPGPKSQQKHARGAGR